MPIRAPRRCTRAGCPGGIACSRHRRKRKSSAELGYDREWRSDSERYRDEHPWCETPGCRRPSAHTDHIDGDRANNQRSNWQALCIPCHSRKTAEHDGGFGRPRTARPGAALHDLD